VLEGGSVEARESRQMKCEVQGASKILKLVDEGYQVTQEDVDKGLVLIELDAKALLDQQVLQELDYQNAMAALTTAREAYEIQLNQNETDLKTADLTIQLNRMDFERYLGEELAGRDGNRFLDQTVNVILDAADLGKLLALRHVVMDEAEAAVGRHGNGHARFGHRVHVGRNDGDVKAQIFRELGVELRVARKNFRKKRRQCDVVEGQGELVVRGKKLIRRLVERIVETGIAHGCHVGK